MLVAPTVGASGADPAPVISALPRASLAGSSFFLSQCARKKHRLSHAGSLHMRGCNTRVAWHVFV